MPNESYDPVLQLWLLTQPTGGGAPVRRPDPYDLEWAFRAHFASDVAVYENASKQPGEET